MQQNLAETSDITSREIQLLQFNNIPWMFQNLIPTQLEIDGVKFPLQSPIDLNEIAKSYGHYKLRLVFFGFVKSKYTIIHANKSITSLTLNYQNKKWFYYLISYSAVSFLLFSKYSSVLNLVIKASLLALLILFDFLSKFVLIREEKDV